MTQISQHEIRAFILHLQQKRCFSNHRFNHVQDRGLSGHTINCYLRSLKIFFSWLISEGILESNPFDRVKIPRSPRKVIPTFSGSQIKHLLGAIDTRTAEGYRHHTIILTLLDTGMRVSELCHLKLDDVWLEDGMLKILGKGNKERLIPIGKQVQRLLWHYIKRYRPQSFAPNGDPLFLTREGKPLTKDRVEKIMTYYGKKAGLKGVRCSPHTLRHTAAVRFLRNGGDVFSLQRMLGHASLEMTRRYCELADIDDQLDDIAFEVLQDRRDGGAFHRGRGLPFFARTTCLNLEGELPPSPVTIVLAGSSSGSGNRIAPSL